MRSIAERANRRKAAAVLASVLALLGCTAGCSKSSSPAAPDQPGGPYIGTWTGTVTSDVIGRGSATVVFDGGFKTPSVIQVTGHWSFEFIDARFSATGTVSGSPFPEANLFVLAFSSATVPCPDATNGADLKGRSASVTIAANRMRGSYIANGCPGGTIDLTRK